MSLANNHDSCTATSYVSEAHNASDEKHQGERNENSMQKSHLTVDLKRERRERLH